MAIAMRKHLPPTNALVVFEAAGRHMNFTRAAKELEVTQSAVSRQIQLLEEFFGLPVFQRQSRGLSLASRPNPRCSVCRSYIVPGTRFPQRPRPGIGLPEKYMGARKECVVLS